MEESGNKHVKVAGFDALAEARSAINDGNMVASIDQQATEQGYQGFSIYASSRKLVPAETLLNVKLIKAGAADQPTL